MNKKMEYTLMALILMGVTYWVFSTVPFKSDVEKTVPVEIFENEQYVMDSEVRIDGQIHRYLFSSKQHFVGAFHLLELSEESTETYITWMRNSDIQKIESLSAPSGAVLSVDQWMYIDKDMTSFGFYYEDGKKMAATSTELMEWLTENHSFN